MKYCVEGVKLETDLTLKQLRVYLTIHFMHDGIFYLLMMLLGMIGSRFGEAGLKELAIQSEAVAEGSIDMVRITIEPYDFTR